jgi:hypothetical protein
MRRTWIQVAFKDLGHCVGRSIIARILRAEDIPPGRQPPMAWRTLCRSIGRYSSWRISLPPRCGLHAAS